MPSYPSPGGEPVDYDKRVGDVLVNPLEPPVGTMLLCTDSDMAPDSPDRRFRMIRDERGWRFLAGNGRPTGRPCDWAVMCKLWLPAEIVSLPRGA
jgi:hypothetical protein